MEEIKIIYPSEIKIKVSSIVDGEGNTIPVQNYPYMMFIFIDDFSGKYECIYDPSGNNSKGTKIKDGSLYVTISNDYKLKGKLRYKIGVKISDDTFPDGDWKWFGEFQPINIKVVCK